MHDWMLTLDVTDGTLALRSRDLLASDSSVSGVIDLCPSPHLTADGLDDLRADYAALIEAVTDTAAYAYDPRQGRVAWSWDWDALRVLRDVMERRMSVPLPDLDYERTEDWAEVLIEDAAERGITAHTTDEQLAAMADMDLADLRASIEQPGLYRVTADGLAAGYTAYRDRLAAQQQAS